jgi:SpoVK/Ycf46/Vps4 family AAA+-type ATPase
MEAYRGLAILATNMKSALDTAFTRRLRFIVSFPFPSLADRRRIWEKAFPPETPKGHIEYDKLGRLNLTGGSIHSAALNAAFLAAQAGTPVTMGLVLKAAKSEFIKMERPVNENDFCWVEPEGVVA